MGVGNECRDLPRTVKEARASGDKLYFTGKPCKRGHVSTRRTSNRKCNECSKVYNSSDRAKERDRQKYLKNREKIKSRNSNRYWEKRDEILQQNKIYYIKNSEKIKFRSAQFYENNKEHCLSITKAWKIKNRDKVRKSNREYEKRNREKCSAKAARRRAAKLKRTLNFSCRILETKNKEHINKIYAERAKKESQDNLYHHVDHIIPLQGDLVSGLHVWYNLRVLAGPENESKGNSFVPYIENHITGEVAYLDVLSP